MVQRSPIFYGWVVWFAASIGMAATSPGQSFSVSLFIDHYIRDFGLDRATVSGLYGLGTFLASLSLTWIGRQIDRQGNRRIAMIIALLFSLVLMASSLITGPITILLSFIAIRGLGQGSLGLTSSTAIAQWFQRRRGWVVGLSLVGFALFQRIYLPWLQGFIDLHGWRQAWLILGAGMAVLVLPALALLIRDRPEQFGLRPDGDRHSEEGDDPSLLKEENWSLGEAMRTPMFWIFTAARMLAGAWGTALIFHQISIFSLQGYSASTAASTYGQIAVLTALFTLISGWWADRLRPAYLVALQMLGLGAATGLALVMNSSNLLLLYSLMFGLFMSIGSVFDGTVWVTLYGRLHQGAIRGFVATAGVMGTAIGPLVYGVSYDYLGNYEPASWLGIILALLLLVSSLVVKRPRHPLLAATLMEGSISAPSRQD